MTYEVAFWVMLVNWVIMFIVAITQHKLIQKLKETLEVYASLNSIFR